jgi:histidyl-tRNA synthetase
LTPNGKLRGLWREPKRGPAGKTLRYKTVKGVHDILPSDVLAWQRLEGAAHEVFSPFGFREIRPPVMEHTELFVRSIGETSDIVEKEMYTFEDKGGRSLTLRPEGTASVVRGYVQHALHTLPAPQKFYYSGPMFRYERPQKGRQRQFYQIGVEAFGAEGPEIDAEVISMLVLFLDRAGLAGLSVQVNSIGDEECRPGYRQALREYFSSSRDRLCEDCQRRYEQNPLRILDCKAKGCRELRQGAPEVSGYLCASCREHFAGLKRMLSTLAIPYEVNAEMVRGLDYYTRTTFEVTSESLGAQNAVAAGGRYDRLVEEFGGPPTPAIGFAVGMERLVSLAGQDGQDGQEEPAPAVFIASLGDEAAAVAFSLADGMRRDGLWVELGYAGGSLKSQMRRADKFGARAVVIIGEEELKKNRANWKDLRSGESGDVAFAEIHGFIKSRERAPR